MIHPNLTISPDPDEGVTISGLCSSCGEERSFTYPESGLTLWLEGTLIQRALPSVHPSKREWLKTAICPDCLQDMVGGRL
jgi:hypothetical protein